MVKRRGDRFCKKYVPPDRGYHSGGGSKKTGHPKRPTYTPNQDPPAIVACPYCMESVIGMKRHYWDDVGVQHRHQPDKYGIRESERLSKQ